MLLGTGESGKSTFVKQMKILQEMSFTEQELRDFRVDLINNVVDCIRLLIEGMETLDIEYEVVSYQKHKYFVTSRFYIRKMLTEQDMLWRFRIMNTKNQVTPSIIQSR